MYVTFCIAPVSSLQKCYSRADRPKNVQPMPNEKESSQNCMIVTCPASTSQGLSTQKYKQLIKQQKSRVHFSLRSNSCLNYYSFISVTLLNLKSETLTYFNLYIYIYAHQYL